MPSLVYAPSITIHVYSTRLQAVIDVSDDLQSWNVHRALGPSVSTADWTLLNAANKYSGIFAPMDRVVIYMRRLKTCEVYSGYLDDVPLWAALPTSVQMTATCTLKIPLNFYWDPHTAASVALFNSDSSADNQQLNDGGLAKRTVTLLETVVGWDTSRVHIGSIPADFMNKLAPLMEEALSDADSQTMALKIGGGSIMGGTTAGASIGSGYTSVTGNGPGTGTLPDTSGKCSEFGGPNGGAYGNMALTGEPGTNPTDPWYCAMRWPYVSKNLKSIPGVDTAKAKQWWANQRILVTARKTHKSVVVRAADWGPNISTGRAIDLSPAAMQALGIATDDIVDIAFADNGTKTAPEGPVAPGVSTSTATISGTGATDSGTYGAPGDESNMRKIVVQGCSFEVHYKMVTNFTGFVNDLANVLGYHPVSIGGYNPRKIAGTSDWSNHAYGVAIDVDPTKNPRYSTGAGGPYALPHPPAIIQLARKWGLGWGGEYAHSKDYMHFEALDGPASPNYGSAPAKTTVGRIGAASTQTVSAKTGSTSTDSNSAGGLLSAQWVVPLTVPYTITAHFGDGGGHWASGTHSGTDFAPDGGQEGASIRPVGAGTVHLTGTGDPDYGNWISVDHGSGVYTQYAHMQSPSSLSTGAAVDLTSELGKVGQTGNATGPHVHVELRLGADTYTAATQSGGIEKYVPGGAPPPLGVDSGSLAAGGLNTATDPTGLGGAVGGGGAIDTSAIGGGLLNVWAWMDQQVDALSLMLKGKRAVMNDEPVMNTIDAYMSAGFRNYCSAPNGDFIAWFPDYFGFYQQAGKMIISDLEISIDNPPVIRWTDEGLKTHQFVIGTTSGTNDDSSAPYRMLNTAGIASVEDARLVQALLNCSADEAKAIAATTAMRLGARPNTQRIASISAGAPEFYFACMEWMKNWSAQYRCSFTTTFMPEIFPGMLACFPDFGLQGYVQEVFHSGDFTGGFTTTISAGPWSTIGDQPGFDAMVRGAPL